jgi:hypothetical protein
VFHDDLEHAIAVYCLPRAARNTLRPTEITLVDPATTETISGKTLDTPEKFRAHYAKVVTASASIFDTYAGVPGSTSKNGTIFIIQLSGSLSKLAVRAVYDMDFKEYGGEKPGTYFTARRYVGASLTHFYDIFYEQRDPGNVNEFGPLFVNFERRARLAVSETHDRFKKAANHPFYFIWWPDPSSPILQNSHDAGTYSGTDPRSAYAVHEGQTSFFFTVPMFPSSL